MFWQYILARQSPRWTTTTTRRSARSAPPRGAAWASPVTSGMPTTRGPPRSLSPSPTTGRAADWAGSFWPGSPPSGPAAGRRLPLHRDGLRRQRGDDRPAVEDGRQDGRTQPRHGGIRGRPGARRRVRPGLVVPLHGRQQRAGLALTSDPATPPARRPRGRRRRDRRSGRTARARGRRARRR